MARNRLTGDDVSMSAQRLDRLAVSVLFATRNRAALLEEALSSLARLDTTGFTWEVVVVDNGSSDQTSSVIARAADRLPLVRLHEARVGKNIALNRGLGVVSGELLVFTDDDVLVDVGWLQAHVRAAQEWPAYSIFGGRIIPRFPPGTPEWLRQDEFVNGLLGKFLLPQPEGPTTNLPLGANFAVRARVMADMQFNERIGPVDGQSYPMGSEAELLKRLTEGGERIVYVPSAVVVHVVQAHQIELPWLLGRSFRLGRGLTRIGFIYGTPATRWFGVPSYMWRDIARTSVRYLLSRILSRPRRFDIAREYQVLRGSVFEHRLMSREQKGKLKGF